MGYKGYSEQHNFSGRYMSTYSFVSQNNLENEAELLWGKNWEAQDDVSQIQELCNLFRFPKYDVWFIEGLKTDEDIEVRLLDSHDKEIVDLLYHGWPKIYNQIMDYIESED